MAVGKAELVTRLQAAAPAMEGAAVNYALVVEDAVAKLGQDCPMRSSTTLPVVRGQASYALPADFARLVQLVPLAQSGGVIVTDVLTPVATSVQRERVIVEGDTLRIEPTPQYSASRTLEYEATFVAAGEAYARLTANGARVALLYARHLVLSQQAGAAAGRAWRFRIGDEEVDKSRLGDAVAAGAKAALEMYQREIAGMRAASGMRAQYDGVAL